MIMSKISKTAADLPIALFDSGMGGLTVFRAIAEMLPEESILYLGDTARLPYGTKSTETIIKYTEKAASYLVERGAKMLVVACNTATASALGTLVEKFHPLPVIGVIEPGASAAIAACKNGIISVIATEATIKGQAYLKALKAMDPDVTVISRACPLFVPLAEEGWFTGIEAEIIAKKYLSDIFLQQGNGNPDTLLLGCTHFPVFRETIKKIIGQDVQIVDSALATALCVRNKINQLGQSAKKQPEYYFLTTDNKERFLRVGSFFLNTHLSDNNVELVDL